MRRALLLLTILAAGAASAIVSAAPARSAADLPSGVAVRVGDATISRARFDHWLDVSVADGGPSGIRRRDYRPPRFERCVALERKAQRKVRPRPTTAQLRRQCEADIARFRHDTLEFLILARWTAGEVAERGVAPTAQELEEYFQVVKAESFISDAEFRSYLRRNRMTLADARFEQAANARSDKLREIALTGVAPVTDAEIADYYQRNQSEFVAPELRDLRAVLTKTRGAATAARQALERGQTWRHVARRYSIDLMSRDSGGLLRSVARGTLDKALDADVFRAPQGKLRGPLRGAFGYHVFKVLKIAPPKQRTLAEVAGQIREQLTFARRGAAVDGFEREMRARWKPRTTCRTGFVIDLCAGTPDADTA